MGMMIELDRAADPGHFLSGLFSGILLPAGVLMPAFLGLHLLIGAAVFLLGLFTFLDMLFPYGRQPYLSSLFGGALAGAAVFIVAAGTGLAYWAVLTSSLLSVILLGSRLLSGKRKTKKVFKT